MKKMDRAAYRRETAKYTKEWEHEEQEEFLQLWEELQEEHERERMEKYEREWAWEAWDWGWEY